MSETRNKILQAASELFLEGGTSALSVRAIAERAGVSTIGIYSHFQGKQGILDALYIEGFELVYAGMRVPKGQASREDVRVSVEGYLNVAENHEAHYRLIFGEVDAGYEPSAEAIAARDKAFGKLVDSAGAYLPEQADREQRRQLALDIWAIVHGYVSIAHHALRQQELSWDWRGMAQRAVSLFLDGLDAGKTGRTT